MESINLAIISNLVDTYEIIECVDDKLKHIIFTGNANEVLHQASQLMASGEYGRLLLLVQ